MIQINLDKSLTRLGLSARQFAIYSDIRPNTLSELKNQNAKMISFDILDRILNGLNDLASERKLNIEFSLVDLIEYEYIRK